MEKISVIVPVYNVEEFLPKGIESLINQTYKNIEIFLVDDGSLDKSGKICDEYAKKDKRIKVIHKKNGGAPEARNVAIEKAKGKYLYFMDADDWIEKDYLEKMYNLIEENKADLIITGFAMEYYQNNKYQTYYTACEDIVYKNKTFYSNAYKYLNQSLLSLPWNKLYSAKIIKDNNLKFPNTKWDDHHFNMEYLKFVNNVVMSSLQKYHWYRSRKGSETMINYSDPNMFKKRKEHYEHILTLYKYWNISDSISINHINAYYVGRLFQCIQELADNKNLSYKEKRKRTKEILADSYTVSALKNCNSLSKKFKILIFPMKLNNVTLSLLFGNFVSIVRKYMPKLFINLKESEVHGN